MERKIGEIFEYNDEWYQTVEASFDEHSCKGCQGCKGTGGPRIFGGECDGNARKDGKFVIFKKLEKFGELVTGRGRTFQCLRALNTDCTGCVFLGSKQNCDRGYYIDNPCFDWEIWTEVKQNQENMEEKKVKLDKLVTDYTSNKITYNEFEKAVKELYADKEESKLSLKSFSLEAAKQGKPVCTRDGRKVRIVCFDAKRKDEKNIIALVPSKDYPGFEDLIAYPNNGNYHGGHENDGDLMMFLEKKEGWINVYKRLVYKTKEEAQSNINPDNEIIDTIKISWEE